MTDPVDEYRARLRLAMDRLAELRSTLEAERRARREPIAVLGAGGRFPPDVHDPARFFAEQLAGRDATGEPSPARHGPAHAHMRRGGWLRDVRGFDAAFFGISPREAAAMDPQQRLLLESTWEALERAGLPPGRLAGKRVGCFVGLTAAEYLGLALDRGPAGRDVYSLTGNGHSFAAGRLAYTFGLQGPCMTVDTACSSSLVAVHLAVRSLRDGESALAVAAGVHLTLTPTSTALLAGSGALAPDGRCRPFDAAADGFTRGEGCGVIILKRLSDAQRDGDPILAVIRGSATNQDGRSAGFTAPSAPAQAAMLRQALADAGLTPADVGYIETHGTGTALGDPIELQALAEVFNRHANSAATDARPHPLILGALKSHAGHLEAAAGIAGIIKTIGILRTGEVPPILHFEQLNPHADPAAAGFVYPTAAVTWPRSQAPRRAGVSAFGMSGSNAHVILEQAPEPPPLDRPHPPHLLALSARTPTALRTLARGTAALITPEPPPDQTDASTPRDLTPEPPPDHADAPTPRDLTPERAPDHAHAPTPRDLTPELADLAYTAARRHVFAHRLALVAGEPAAVARALRAFADGDPPAAVHHGHAAAAAPIFVCSGQGSTWPGMGRGLEDDPAARAVLDAMEPLVARHGGFSLRHTLTAPDAPLHDTSRAQPAILAVSLAVAAVLRAAGVQPAVVIGHSVGEIAAAHLAGALELDDAVRLACVRGRVMQPTAGRGGMLSLELDEPAAVRRLAAHPGLSLAAVNGPRSVVVAGDTHALDRLLAELAADAVPARRLRVDFAFHGPPMAACQPALRAALADLRPARAGLRMISTVTGEPVVGPELDADHWTRGVRDPVLLARAVARALADGPRPIVELGPHPVLLADLTACAPDCRVLATLRRDRPARPELLQALAALFAAGAPVDLGSLHPTGRIAPLPTYPFERRDHWLPPVKFESFGFDNSNSPDLSPGTSEPRRSASGAATDLSSGTSDPSRSQTTGPSSHLSPGTSDPRPPASGAATDLSPRTPDPSRPSAPASHLSPGTPEPAALSAARRAAPEARRALLAGVVRDELGAVLGLAPGDAVAPREGLFDLGLDSMMAVDLRGRLERRLGLTLAGTVVFDHPTLEALAAHLAELAAPAPLAAATAPSAVRGDDPIAVIGLACRFPGGAVDPGSFWRLLHASADAIVDVPPDRWDADAYHPDHPRRAGFLQGWDVAGFDAAFFRISPLEARALDPQQRLLLELAWEALEHAGQSPDALVGSRTGVYVGIATADYAQIATRVALADLDPYLSSGTAPNTAAGRVSHFLGLQGPAIALDTACSSSLVATHLGCQSLRRGETDLALVGGVNLMLVPIIQVMYARLGTLAADARTKAFDAAADGMVRGEGGAFVVLKRLADARRDGDRVLATIRGSAVNHDGRSAGLTVPSGPAQRKVVRAALADAALAPNDVAYVEAHGTGTALGDPIEANALIAELGPGRERPLVLGAVKANIGHLEAAAGVAGIIKTVLALQHGELPPQLNFNHLNPAIDAAGVPLEIPTAPTPWPAGPRIAGVSSFGMSGTNAHVLLSEPPPDLSPATPATTPEINLSPGTPGPTPPRPDLSPGTPATTPEINLSPGTPAPPRGLLLPLSARSPAALRALAEAWRARLADETCPIDQLCAAAARRRAHLEHRLALTGLTRADLRAALDAHLAGELHPGWSATAGSGQPRLAFVFAGHSGHWVGMGRELLRGEPAFAAALHACARALAAHRPGDLIADLTAVDAAARWTSAEVLQPVVLAVQIALAELWSAWGVAPQAVVGHSMGEIAAACVAGAIDLDAAFGICVQRSRLIERLRGRGAMASVAVPQGRIAPHLAAYAGRIAVAAANSPILTVLSGDPDALTRLAADLTRQNIFVRPLRDATAAGHSPHLDPLLPELRAALADLRPRDAAVPIWSTVTAAPIAGSALDAAYWARNLREPVLFAPTIQAMGAAGLDAFLEVSPHPLLLGAVEQTLRPRGGAITRLGSLKTDAPERPTLLASAARLYSEGLALDWPALAPESPHVELPSYPWQRRRHWTDAPPWRDHTDAPAPPPGAHPLLPRPVHHARTGELLWDLTLEPARAAALGAVHVQDIPVVPAARLLDLTLAAAAHLSPRTAVHLADVTLGPALVLDAPLAAQIVLTPHTRVELLTRRPGEPWTASVRATLAPAPSDSPTPGARTPAPSGGSPTYAAPAPSDSQPAPSDSQTPGANLTPALSGGSPTYAAPAPSDSQPAPSDSQTPGANLTPALSGGSPTYAAPAPSDSRPAPSDSPLAAARARCTVAVPDLRADLQARGLALPPGAWPLRDVRRSAGAPEAVARVEAPPAPGHAVSPVALAAGLQLLTALVHGGDERPVDGELFAARALAGLHVAAPGAAVAHVHAALRGPVGPSFGARGDLTLHAADDSVVASLRDVDVGPPDRGLARRALLARLDRWLYEIAWQPAPPAAPRPEAPGSWLLLADADGLAEQLAARLAARGERPLFTTPDAFAARLREARARGPLRAILHLRALDVPADDALPATLEAESLALVQLARALAEEALPTRLVIVTRGAEPIDGGPRDLIGAPLWALARTIGLEQQGVRVEHVDLSPRPAERELDDLIAELDDPGLEDQVALRDGRRLVARLVRADRPRPAAPLTLRPDATYLVTGGLGGVGLQVAAWLVDRGARHLLLVGRTGLREPAAADLSPGTPDPAATPDLSPGTPDPDPAPRPAVTPDLSLGTPDPDPAPRPAVTPDLSLGTPDPARQRREAVARLRAAGARVTVAAVDVADLDAMARVLADIPPGLPLRGVFHAAGTSAPEPLARTSPAALRALYRPKVAGGWALHRLTQGLPLDHFVGFASAAATWGAALLGPYAAANHFLDVLAHHRRAAGLPALAVDWGGWSGGGMASADVQRYAADMGLEMAPAAHFLEALDLFLQTGTTRATIGPIRWRMFKAVLEARGPRPLLEHIDPGPDERAGGGVAARRIAAAPPAARWELLLAHVRQQAAAVLGFADPEALDPAQGFFQIGMDSVMSVRLRGDLEASLGCPLPPTLAFERPSALELATFLAREVLAVDPPAPPPAPEPAAPPAADLDALSEDQLAALLAAELDAT